VISRGISSVDTFAPLCWFICGFDLKTSTSGMRELILTQILAIIVIISVKTRVSSLIFQHNRLNKPIESPNPPRLCRAPRSILRDLCPTIPDHIVRDHLYSRRRLRTSHPCASVEICTIPSSSMYSTLGFLRNASRDSSSKFPTINVL